MFTTKISDCLLEPSIYFSVEIDVMLYVFFHTP